MSMIKVTFDDANAMNAFMNFNSDMCIWEVVLCRLSASNGITLDINTLVNDTLGLSKYVRWDQVKATVTNFIEQNSHMAMNIEIKLKYPDANRKVMDSNDYYSAFYLNFFSNNIDTYASTSFLENDTSLPAAPIVAWGVFVQSLYNDWQNSLD